MGAFLRRLTLADLDELYELRKRNEAFFTPYEPAGTYAEFSKASVRKHLELDAQEHDEGRGAALAICREPDGMLVGRIRLSAVFRGPWNNANLGYYVDEAQMGRGYATDAVRLAVRYAFDQLALHRVQAAVLTDNPRSKRVLEKNTFRHEGLALRYLQIGGVYRDHDIFAITVEDLTE